MTVVWSKHKGEVLGLSTKWFIGPVFVVKCDDSKVRVVNVTLVEVVAK